MLILLQGENFVIDAFFSCGNYSSDYNAVLLSCPARPHMPFIPLALGVPSALTASMSKTPLDKLRHFIASSVYFPIL